MSHFAKVIDGIVTEVLVISQSVVDSGEFGDPALWVQTSYNTRGGVHYGPDGQPDGPGLRKNYAGIGFTYSTELDAFIPPQPYPSWSLNEETCLWYPPVPYPDDGKMYVWDEATLSWVEVVPEPVPPPLSTLTPVMDEPVLSTVLSTYTSTVNE